jgi:FkbH-like protein
MTTSSPTPQERRAGIEALLSAKDAEAALFEARRLWASGADAAVARFIKRHGQALWGERPMREHRVAILRSFTVEPVVPLLEAEAALAGVRIEPWVGAFNAYAQEILDPAGALYAHNPDTVILSVQARDVAPALWERFGALSAEEIEHEIDRAARLLTDLLGALRRSTGASILCHGLERPLDPNEGLLEANRAMRQADAIEAVNRRLRAWCAGQAGTYVLDYDQLVGRHGRERWFDEKKFATARLPLSVAALGWLAAEWWRHLAVLALPPAKVLALDLDNTLWGGVIGEDGPHGVRLGKEAPGVFFRGLQQTVLDIARRGVLVVLVSKNNEADALEVIDTHPEMLIRRGDLAGWRINWTPKPANLVDLARELNLGLDAFVFVDDNPAECEAVRRALPEIDVVELPEDPAHYPGFLRRLPRLQRLSTSQEDAERGRYYADERERRVLQSTADSLESFLGSLEIEVGVESISPSTLARAAQLTQKTNQLNMTTRRYTEAELEHRLRDATWSGYVLRARDRFGDNGVVGAALLHHKGGDSLIDTFLLSCRVIGRGIETAFLARLASDARRRGASRLLGEFLPTAKNAPAANIYKDAGFTLEGEEAAMSLWRLDLETGAIVAPAWISWTGEAEI